MNAGLVLERAVRVDVAHGVAVVGRIRIDNRADRAILGRQLRLDTTPRLAIFNDDDLAFDVDAVALEHVVVRRDAVVDEHEFAFHVAVDRERVIRRQQIIVFQRTGISVDGHFGQRRSERARRREFEFSDSRRRQENVVLLDRDVVAPGLHEPGQELGVFPGRGRAGMMRTRRQPPHPRIHVLCAQVGIVGRLNGALRIDGVVRETADGLLGRSRTEKQNQ